MEKFTPEYAETISGVDRNLIIAGGAPVCHGARTAPSTGRWASPELSHGTANALALIHLALLTGHIGRRGHRAQPAARAE